RCSEIRLRLLIIAPRMVYVDQDTINSSPMQATKGSGFELSVEIKLEWWRPPVRARDNSSAPAGRPPRGGSRTGVLLPSMYGTPRVSRSAQSADGRATAAGIGQS